MITQGVENDLVVIGENKRDVPDFFYLNQTAHSTHDFFIKNQRIAEGGKEVMFAAESLVDDWLKTICRTKKIQGLAHSIGNL
ncbi:MAG: hypothetical protein AAGM67_15290 [Bacteroidota bacterium]